MTIDPSTQDAAFVHVWLRRYPMSESEFQMNNKKFDDAAEINIVCRTPTRFTIRSSESHQAIAWIAIDSIHAGCTVSTCVVNAIVDI